MARASHEVLAGRTAAHVVNIIRDLGIMHQNLKRGGYDEAARYVEIATLGLSLTRITIASEVFVPQVTKNIRWQF